MVFVNCYAVDTSIKQGLGRRSRHFPSFDEHLFTHHPSEHLRMEDERINKLDHRTKRKWEEHATGNV